MKKRIAFLLVSSMLLSLCTLSGYAAQTVPREQAKALLTAAYADDQFVIKRTDEHAILSQFAAEIRYVENKYQVRITELNEEILELLKHEAVQNLYNSNYRFVDLMDTIVIASAEARLERTVSMNSAVPFAEPVVKIEVIRPFGPLRGKHFMDVPTNTTTTIEKTGTVGISAGTSFKDKYNIDVTIDANISKSVSYAVTGPKNGEKLFNGQVATHQSAYGVMYGTIVKHTVTDSSGNTNVFRYIDQTSISTVSYTTLSVIGVPTYANTRNNSSLRFTNQLNFYSAIEENPAQFL